MNITGVSNLSGLSSAFASGELGSSKAAGGSSAASSSDFSISQIRDKVDQLATSGQLTTAQQRAMIAAGFQDLDANNPSYQPASQTGGNLRTDAQTLNVNATLESISSFYASKGDAGLATTYSGLADLLQKDGITSNLNVTA
jgi:hypothetical protein